ncbi:MAG: nucleotidyl transferase AbiEii/AbiGii toxin family protein [Pirellulales bacterium]|nr:nucleotidyl transferase AbiEii/AbiGii toxin family protein [Pirellulales bacterium]
MRLEFLDLSSEERRVYFEQAGQQRGVLPVILEKDFWVCWMLAVLFDSDFGDALVFKGGTSLSKVFGTIDRFSEDIDLSVSPEMLNLRLVDPRTLSRNQANRWMEEAEAACGKFVVEQLQPYLEAQIAAALGPHPTAWLEFMIDPLTRSPVLLFYYPCGEPEGFAYLRRSVKLEFGSLTDQQPAGHHPVRPWVATELPQAFGDWQCSVIALELERTFWEKATILHVEWHRPPERATPDRFSRHYSDMAALAAHEVANTA